MKQLQSNFTTIEQSKKLLELGLPVDSADCYYCYESDLVETIPQGHDFITYCINCIPCWSVGRLMEIYDTCVKLFNNSIEDWCSFKYVKNKLGKTYIEYLIDIFDVHVKETGYLDFSKLEE